MTQVRIFQRVRSGVSLGWFAKITEQSGLYQEFPITELHTVIGAKINNKALAIVEATKAVIGTEFSFEISNYRFTIVR